MCRFAQFLHNEGKAPSSIANAVSTIRTIQALKGFKQPDLFEICVKLHLKGLKNLSNHVIRQAEPVTPQLLLKMSRLVDRSDLREVTSFTAILVSFFLLLRKSNLTPDTIKKFDANKQFVRGDALIGSRTVLLDLRWTKTMQKNSKVIRLPLLPLVKSDICPIVWIKRMISAIPGKSTDPLFMIPDRYNKNFIPLTYRVVMKYFKKWVELAIGTCTGYSMHSLRRGGATWCFNIDITTEAIRMMGTWASDSYKKYLDLDLNKRVDTMEKITSSINKVLHDL